MTNANARTIMACDATNSQKSGNIPFVRSIGELKLLRKDPGEVIMRANGTDMLLRINCDGTTIAAKAQIGKRAYIGKESIILEGATIGDDVTIRSNVLISNAEIGNETVIEDNVIIWDRATIGERIKIGAGTIVTMGRKVPKGTIPIRRNSYI